MTVGPAPLVLFGAFDRHNLGDLLLARIAEAEAKEAGRAVRFAGLAAADFASCGGPVVEPLPAIADEWEARYGAQPLELVHAGGELLDCDAWEAAVMLAPAEEAEKIVAALDRDRAARTGWAARRLGTARHAPYVISRRELPPRSRIEFRAVGGVGLAHRSREFQQEVWAALREAESVSVRDRITCEQLRAAGVRAALAPDPVTSIAARLGPEIAARAETGEALAAAGAPPDRYLAVQFAAEMGDDARLDALAQRLEKHCRGSGCGVVLFRAGAAPWHDALEPYERLARRLAVPHRLFPSLHVLDIAALISRAAACYSSSLHCRIIARAYRVSVEQISTSPGQAAKLAAWIETWGESAN